jgi:DNA repair protein RecN (Recombination protein N)
MLLELNIKDFAIIDSLRVGFGPGLNIFTGETGAGKSIIMDALSLILGDRASNEIIRQGAEEAQVEALFDVSAIRAKGLDSVLSEAGLAASDELIIKRVVQRAGRNRIYINGSLATLVTLTEVGRRLIDIYGQSEHQSLTRPEEHIELLDTFGSLAAMRTHMADVYREYAAARKELDSLVLDSRNTADKKGFLAYQLKELVDADFKAGEEESLRKQRERLQNAGKLGSVTEEAERAIYSDSGSITERLGSISKALKELSAVDPALAGTAKTIEECLVSLEDAGAFLRDYSSSVESDPEALEAASDRLDLIGRLRKKHGCTLEELIAKKDALEAELRGLDNIEFRAGELEARVKGLKGKAEEAARHLTEARKTAAAELESLIEGELTTLGMKGVVFEAAVDADAGHDGGARLTEKGADRVSFFIATNKGEGLKPLARIASGGELSRIMLAMKSVMATGRVSTLIFDEIDTGVSGSIAQVVGLKLKEVSGGNQVLCITHLPQVAAFADRHFVVSKKAAGGRTVTNVVEAAGEDRVEEISAMLGGLKVTDTTRKHAAELIEAAIGMSGRKKAPVRRPGAAEGKG